MNHHSLYVTLTYGLDKFLKVGDIDGFDADEAAKAAEALEEMFEKARGPKAGLVKLQMGSVEE